MSLLEQQLTYAEFVELMAFYQLKHEESEKASGQTNPESDKARLEAYLAQQQGPPKEH